MPAAAPPRKRPRPVKQKPMPEELHESLAHVVEALKYCWEINGRPEQNPDDFADWVYWVYLAGRGTGKTRAGAERVRQWAEHRYGIIHLVAPTAADARDTMINGPAGILAVSPPWFMPNWEPSKRLLTWPNGAMALVFSADEPDRLRGPQCEAMWLDELGAWRYQQETWDMAQMGLRLGNAPKCIITSTPKTTKLIKELVKGDLGKTIITRGKTYDNADNLAPAFMNIIVKRYAGTRLGLQEIDGQILDDNPNALWKRADIDKYRVRKAPELHKIVIAIDPGVSDGKDPDAAEIGIVAAGVNYDEAEDPTYYVLEDASVGPCSPFIWASAAITCYHKTEGDEIIGEGNNGGALVGSTIEAVEQGLPYEMVTASRGKRTRAEPVSALYEKGRVHHVGSFPDLESQMCEWVPGEKSPDRMDALVWAITRLAQNDETFAASRI